MYINNNRENYRKLPTKLYLVRIPIIATYTSAEIDLVGLPQDTTDGKPDEACYENLTTCMISLDRFIEVYENGFRIYLVNQNHVSEIYKTFEQYLLDWKETIQYSPNVDHSVKDERLTVIDKLLTEVFDNNRVSVIKGMVGTNDGYGSGLNLMGMNGMSTTQMNEPVVSKPVGIMAGYTDDTTTHIPDGQTYIQPNMPYINMDEVKRTNTIQNIPDTPMGFSDFFKDKE